MKAVIFDMDGVIVDTEPINRQVALQFAKDYKLNLTAEAYNTIIGTNNFFDLLQKLNPQQDVSNLQEIYRNYQKTKQIDYLNIFRTNLPTLLQELKEKNYQLAVASSSSLQTITKVLKACNIIDYFNILLSGKDVKRGKPYPDIFLEAAKMLAVPPQNCIVIEDSHNGICAATKAGMQTIAVKNPEYTLDISEASTIVDNLTEITYPFIERLLS